MLDPSIFSRYKTKQDFDREAQEFEARKRAREMQEQLGGLQIKKAEKQLSAPEPFNLKKVAEQALYKRNMGLPLDIQEEAAVQSMGQIAPPVYRTDEFGRTIAAPSGWSNVLNQAPGAVLNAPNMQPEPMVATQEQMPNTPLPGTMPDTGSTFDIPPYEQVAEPEQFVQGGMTPIPQPQVSPYMPETMVNMPAPPTVAPTADFQATGQMAGTPAGAILENDIRAYAARAGIDLNKFSQQERIKMMNDISTQMIKNNMKLEQSKQEKAPARKQFDETLASVLDAARELRDMGAGVRTTQSPEENIGARLRSTTLGQEVGKAVGTKEQQLRDFIDSKRPVLFNAIKKASGLTGSELNSQFEVENQLKQLGNDSINIDTRIKILEDLSNMFGLGRAEEYTGYKGTKQRYTYNPATGMLE